MRFFRKNNELPWGFTMVEVVVMLAIITALSTVVLASFGGLNESTALNRGARELALSIRRAQNMSLAVTAIEIGSPATFQIPPAVGVKISTVSPTNYFIFADLAPVDNKFTDSSEKISGTNVTFERNVKVQRILGEGGILLSTVHVLFVPPEATLFFTDADGSSISGDKIDIELISPNGLIKKTVTVRTSGQIGIK